MTTKKKFKFDYTWIIILSSFIMVMISLGFTSSTKSLFPDEIAKDLGVSRSLVSIGESCRYIATAVVNIFFGFLVTKFGSKILVCGGYICLIVSMFLYSIADNLIVIYIGGTLLGIGLSFTATTMVGYIIGMWCSRNKGTIMGLVLAANGLGGAIAIKIAGKIIDPNVVGSYRGAYRMIAYVLIATFVFLLIFMRNKPKHTNNEDLSSTKKAKKRGQDWVGIEFKDAVHKFYFWGVLVCIFFAGVIIQGTSGITKMHFLDEGVDYTKIVDLLAYSSIILVAAKFSTGFIYDRFGLRISASICTITAVITTFILVFINGGDIGYILALIYTIISPFATPLETVMLPIYAADLFGKKSYAKVLGLFVSVNTAGYAVGSPLMNLCHDITGSYKMALVIVGIIMSCVFILLQFVISMAHKDQKRIIEEQLKEKAVADSV